MPKIRVHDLAEIPDAYIVDVREVAEYAVGHLPAAINVPLSMLPVAYRRLPADRRIYVVCDVGHRSAQATRVLVTAGVDAVDVSGGTTAWVAAGYPLEM
jgi:rhodanese-related sulfurtransferase